MSGSPPPRWLAFAPALSFLAVVIGALMAGGGYVADLRDDRRRIEILEARLDTIHAIDVRTARIEERTAGIEERLQMILPLPEKQRNRR